jgi:hypothetical protein
MLNFATSMESLQLDLLTVVCPTERSFPLGNGIVVIGLRDLIDQARITLRMAPGYTHLQTAQYHPRPDNFPIAPR